MFFLTKAVMPHFKKGGVIINTASVTAYQGSPELLDYSATKGAIVAFTRSLSQALAEKKIRVNAVAPGPIWTPLIPSTFPAKEVATFGSDTPLGRAGEPEEVATSFVFLASDDSSLHDGAGLASEWRARRQRIGLCPQIDADFADYLSVICANLRNLRTILKTTTYVPTAAPPIKFGPSPSSSGSRRTRPARCSSRWETPG